MDQIKTVTKQDIRDLILKCCKQCLSAKITELDISFNSIYIEVKIPEAQQPDFRNRTLDDPPEFQKFDNKIKLYSFDNLMIVTYYTVPFENAAKELHSKLLSSDIACNYQIAE